jgi:peptidoglycan/LPS O-acetylase OafA/YrhL
VPGRVRELAESGALAVFGWLLLACACALGAGLLVPPRWALPVSLATLLAVVAVGAAIRRRRS